MRCEKCGNEFEGNFCPECGTASSDVKNICSGCGTEFEGNFCPNCGKPAGEETVRCSFCGAEVKGSFCPNCGRIIERTSTEQPAVQPQVIINHVNYPMPMISGNLKNKWVAFLLCLFLGVLGVHKFYEGKVLMGLVYLFTGGLCGIGWFVDLIVLLCKPNPYTV